MKAVLSNCALACNVLFILVMVNEAKAVFLLDQNGVLL